MRRHALHAVLAALALSVSACASMTPFARLTSAVVDDRYAGSLSSASLRVVRGNTVVAPSTSMGLLKGDSIITSPTTRAVVTFKAGYEVTLDTNTAIYIENPSIFLRIGQAFIRKVFGARTSSDTAKKLDTHTPQVSFTEVGTEYLVSVSGQATDVMVVSGAVAASSRDGRWPGVTYTARQGGRITQGGPLRIQPVSDRQLADQLRWVRRVEAITKVPVPNVGSMTEDAARAELQRAGLRESPYVMHRETADVAPGLVVDQSPGAGQTAAPGTYVTLTLAKAPPTRSVPADSTRVLSRCVVPDLYKKSETTAKAMLERARLRWTIVSRDPNSSTVVKQDPASSTRVACNSVVKLTISTIIE